jgi:UDP-N-acetylglucosamine 2-epimerase (non-hydrolysing)
VATARAPWQIFDLNPGEYALLTLHRPSNVDDPDTLRALIGVMNEASTTVPILFPVHPRTRERIALGNIHVAPSVRLSEPLPYLLFLGLMAKARYVLTDSGGIQEETTALSVPCLTLRWNTERPITIKIGTNRLVGTEPQQILQHIGSILSDGCAPKTIPPLWDGRAAYRIVDVIETWASA